MSRSSDQRRALVTIAFGLMLAMTTRFSTSAVLPELRARWDLTTNESSLLVVVLQLGFVTGAVASAALGVADRVSLRSLILISAFLGCVVMLAPGPFLGAWALRGLEDRPTSVAPIPGVDESAALRAASVD